MDKIELCIFDMDGLLIDTERYVWLISEKRALEIMGYQGNEEDFKAAMGGKPDLYLDKIVTEHPEFSKEKFYEILYDNVKKIALEGNVPLMPGAKKLLDYLKSINMHMAIGTSSPKWLADILIKNTNIGDYFESITTINNVQKAKPAPDIYLHAYNNFTIKKENTLVFEDAHNGIRSALAAGLNVIVVPDLAMVSEQDKKDVLAVINSLDEAIEIIQSIN